MIFKRRDKRLTFVRLREIMLPKKGLSRAAGYFIHRVKRLPDTPHKIAIGIATGVFCSFTPFFGLHFFLAAFMTYLFKGNMVAALLGTFFGNPITWPFIASFSVKLGQIMLGQTVTNFETFWEQFIAASDAIINGFKAFVGSGESDWNLVYNFLSEIFIPYFLGGFVLGVISASLSYFIFRPIIYAYKVTRNKKKFKKVNRGDNSIRKKF